MASLTIISYYARKMVFYFSVGLAALIIFRFSWVVFSSWWIKNHPPAPPPPTVSFGVLPSLQLPKGILRSNLVFRLETITGMTPNLGIQAKVYFMPAFRANVLGAELATQLAVRLGFPVKPESVDEQIYVWSRTGRLPAKLTINLITGFFSLETSWADDQEIISSRAPSQPDAVKTAKDFLSRLDLLPKDLEIGKSKVEYLKEGENGFISAISQSEANFVRVHLFRSDIDSIPIVTPTYDEGLVQVVVTGLSSDKQVIGLSYKYSPVDTVQAATYPLKSSQSAWQELQAGGGSIIKYSGGTNGAVIRNIELAYFESGLPQEFLQPIFIFKGDNGFIAYLPATDSKWLSR